MTAHPARVVIGIDPDVDASGVCIVSSDCDVSIQRLAFFDLCELLAQSASEPGTIAIIEAGWLNKRSNWHGAASQAAGARIAKNVGANHQIGKLLCDLCDRVKLERVLVRPHAGKLTAAQFRAQFGDIVPRERLRMSQDERDASAIAIWYAQKLGFGLRRGK